MKPWVVAVMTMVLGMGCAGVAPTSSLSNARAPCLPEGISPVVLGWPVVLAVPLRIESDQGMNIPGVMLRFQSGSEAVAIIWTPAGLISVDSDPDGSSPGWMDLGLMTPRGQVRSEPSGRCEWRLFTARRAYGL
jgi:hypothetical protein